ncbi:MAG: hypothetical protein U0O22_02505 [Acutalibacteraceae bacterium]
MSNELNVGRIVAEIALEAETKNAEDKVKASAENIKSTMKTVADTPTQLQIHANTKPAIDEAKEANRIVNDYFTRNAPQVFDKEGYRRLLTDLMTDTQIQVPVAIQVDTTSTEMMLQKIREQLQGMGFEAGEVEKIMQSCFSDITAYSNYEKQLDVVATKLEIQRRKVEELQATQSKYKGRSLGNHEISAAEKVTRAYESESLKLQQLERQFDRAIVAQDNYVNRKVTAYQRAEAAAQKAADKEALASQRTANKDATFAITELTYGMTAFNSLSPVAMNNLRNIIRQITLLRRVSQSGASQGVMIFTGAMAGLITVATLVANVVQSVVEKQEESRKKAVELSKSYQDDSTSIQDLSDKYIELKMQLDKAILSRTEEKDAQTELLEIQEKLIETYGNEAKALDLVNGKITEQISNIEALNKAKAQEIVAQNYNQYNEAKEKLAENKPFSLITGMTMVNPAMIGIEKTVKEYQKVFENTEFYNGTFSINFDITKAKDELVNLGKYTDKLIKDDKISKDFSEQIKSGISNALSNLDTEKINQYKTIVEEYENALDVINGKSKTNIDIQEQIYTQVKSNASTIEDLASAYSNLSEGEKLDSSKLMELCDTYPKLAQYIAETGDLSLENGNKIKAVQKELLQSNIRLIESNRDELVSKKNLTAEETSLLQNYTASLKIYQEQLKQLNTKDNIDLDSFKASADDLSSAYNKLINSKKLDFETTLSLIQTYPEIAQAMAEGNNSMEKQKAIIEKLYEAKKKELLLSLEADQKELQSLIKTNNAKIAEYERMIEAYHMVASVVTEYKSKIADLQKENKNNKDSLNETLSTIKAIKNMSIADFSNDNSSSTSKTNEKLKEQLELIEHRRALNNLTYAEEISWLKMLYAEYTETAEERMSLEEKIYTAQQNSIKEQQQAYSDLYDNQIKKLEHLKNLDQLSKQQELAWLNTLNNEYVLTTEQRMSLEEKIHNVQKEISEEKEQAMADAVQAEYDLLEHEKAMDRLSAEEELKWLERIYRQYAMSSKDRSALEEKIHSARKNNEEEIQKLQEETLEKAINALENRRKVSRMTYEEEIKQLREIYNTYKLTAEQQQKVLEQIRSVSESAKSERSSQFSTVASGVIEALENRYQKQREAEEQLINDSIDGWQRWENETVNAIQSQIDALDKLADTQKSEDERREYENKRQAAELLMAYEHDDYNRKQYEKELARLDNEEAQRLAEEQREQKRQQLQEQIESVKKESSAQQDLLNAELEAISKNYEKVMSQYSLENEAYRMMLDKSQNEIVKFIASFAPEYELAGKTLGEKLYSGLKNKIKDINYWFKELDVKWQYYSNQTATLAHKTVDDFWNSRANYQQQLTTMTQVPNINLTVNFNESVESPVQVARKMEEVTNNLVSQLKQ